MMKINSRHLAALLMLSLSFRIGASEKMFSLFSPDKRTEVKIYLNEKIKYSVLYDKKIILAPSSISMTLNDGKVIGEKPILAKEISKTVSQEIKTLYGTNASIKDNYNELILSFKNSYSLVFRAYNNGAAYRFETNLPGEIIIKNEEATFAFPDNYKAYFIRGKKENYIYEGTYLYSGISSIDSGRVAVIPMTIDVPNGPKVSIAESDLVDYPGMYLFYDDKSLKGTFRNVPVETNIDDKNAWTVWVKKTADHIARTKGTRSFPWRIIMISDQDKDLMSNELVYLLASEPKKDMDFSWVKPGKIINDWWDILGGSPQEVILTGVDFKSGINYDTYKYYIDFAIEHNIEYVNMDYGWSDPQDFSKIFPALDIQKLLNYSREKNKKVMLWCIAKTLYRNLEENMDMFEKWGIAGLKVDFFERDDQEGINDYIRIADAAARHHLLLEYHGATKPTGLSRTYPNVLTYEAVKGSEFNKVNFEASPDHDVTMPFMRTLAGAFDYGPGVMKNVSKSNFCALWGCSMSQGTRCHQLAMFMVYYSPLQFMVDVPTTYIKEPAFLDFLSEIPSAWDITLPLNGRIGEYITIARKKGGTWYVGSMTNWTARTIKLKCDFLGDGEYSAEIISDGINADRNGSDYKMEKTKVRSGDELTISMAPGGGWAAIIRPVK